MTSKSSNGNPLQIHHTRIVLRSAIASRLLLIALIILWRSLLSPYDTSASINPNCLSSTTTHHHSPPILFPRIASAIEDSIVWDSVYFVRIAQCGYEYEQAYAFLPLLPICISFLSRTVFAPLIPLIGHIAVLGLSGYVLNNIVFVFAAVYLYRGVGFLRYFQLKQLPNFLVASPILSLALCSIIHYIQLQPEVFFSLGFRASAMDKKFSAVLFSLGEDSRSQSSYSPERLSSKIWQDHIRRRRKQTITGENPDTIPLENESTEKPGYLSVTVLPFVLHLGFMAATAFFVMHVQVATRFLSASPPLYWFASYLMVFPGIGKAWGYFIWAYCAAYILLGSLLFSNFYPFT